MTRTTDTTESEFTDEYLRRLEEREAAAKFLSTLPEPDDVTDWWYKEDESDC